MSSEKSPHSFHKYRDGLLRPCSAGVVKEYPLQLIVNGREIATLIASPHDLRFLVAGFLRLQGFVSDLSDFELFSVCDEFGIANVRIRKELPERLKPVLTSGCGTGVTFNLPSVPNQISGVPSPDRKHSPAAIFSLMEELAKRADQYRSHGGIHSAAVGRSGKLALYAEDLGRHNTLDRIAGEALFRGINLAGTELVTSGRVSTEMVAKAALLDIRLIASRTSPTDMAVRLCEQTGICLAGYVRGGGFNVYSHPEFIDAQHSDGRISGVTGVILAGGASKRMGRNKALMEVCGAPIITRTYATLSALFDEVIIVTNTPDDYDFLPCRKVPDIYPETGSIAGLHSALTHIGTKRAFVTACDMPFLDPAIVRHLCEVQLSGYDAVIPFSEGGQDPLLAVYGKSCAEAFESAINNGERKILDILAKLKTRLVTWDEIRQVAGSTASFLNVNTPEEFGRIQSSSGS